MTIPTFHNLIGGHWLPASSGKTILNLNPADHNDVVGAFPASQAEDVDLAVQAARKAFATWRLVPAPKRAEILQRAGNLLVQNKEKLPVRLLGGIEAKALEDAIPRLENHLAVNSRRP